MRSRASLGEPWGVARPLEVLADNVADGIPADRTTALMAAAVIRKLVAFAVAAGVDPAELPGGPADLPRFVQFQKARRKETHARYRR